MNTITKVSKRLESAGVVVVMLAAIKLLVHLLTAGNYGLFVDELYFLACGQHLAWGYVDMPPMAAVLGWLARLLFGDSVAGIHVIPALAGTGLILLNGWLVKELGGNRLAQLTAGLCGIAAGVFLTLHSYLSMNAVEPLIWVGCALILVKLVKTGNQRLWIFFGILAGIGLMTKYTMLLFGAGALVGLLLTPHRKWLLNRWLLLGGLIALIIFLPNLVWMIQHDFPMLELLSNIRESGRNVKLNPLQFLADEIMFLQPLTLPIWLGGLIWFFFHPQGKPYRYLGWAFVFVLGALLLTQGRTYYLAPGFPMLLAAGGMGFEKLVSKRSLAWVGSFYLGLLFLGGAITAPLFLPVLSPEAYIRYAQTLKLRQPKIETFQESALPQLFADRFGWPEMAQKVAEVYQSLSEEEQSQAVVLAGNYGQAGAIDFYGPALGLPGAISGHQNYYYWGLRGASGEIAIAIGIPSDVLRNYYLKVDYAGQTHHAYAMAYENTPIYICRNSKKPLIDVWESLKSWN